MTCDQNLLRRSLDDRLTEAEEESLSAHLSGCDACQRELERLAGRPAAWARVGTTLKAACLSSDVSFSGVGVEQANDHDSATDFAVECLVHRDVKPANILLEISVEKVMLTDFGLARAIDDASITRTGVIARTPLYMSPEQARGEPVDARSDLFSLGSVLYTLATGRTPFRAESTYGILRRLTDDNPRPVREISPQLPAWFGMIVQKLLAKCPGDRFGSAVEVAQLLEGCLAHVQQPGTVSLPAECTACVKPRRFRMWASIAAVAFLGVVGLWKLSDQSQQESSSNESRVGDMGNFDSATQHQHQAGANPETDWDAGERRVSPLRNDFDQWNKNAEKLWQEAPP